MSAALPYKPFRDAYLVGRKSIEEHRLPPGAEADEDRLDECNERLEEAADNARNTLLNTEFGRKLCGEEGLRALADELESNLQRLTRYALDEGLVANDAPVIQWSEQTGFGAERQFRFWGELGHLFHYFRDLGQSLDTSREVELRTQCRSRTAELHRVLKDITDNAIIHLAYKPNVVKQIEALFASLDTLNAELATPIDEALDGPNLLQGGATVLRRQFANAVSFMAFELYGHLLPRNLGTLLTLKSSTAEELGFSAWWQMADGSKKSSASRGKDQRNYIAAALKSGISRAKAEGWVTLPVLQFFSENREMLFKRAEEDEDIW